MMFSPMVKKLISAPFAGVQLDGRTHSGLVIQALALCFYVVVGLYFQRFLRRPDALAVALLTPVLVDLALSIWLEKKVRVPLGPLIAGFGFFLHVGSWSLLAYVMAGFASQLSKRYLTADGRQIFNPSNFAVLAVLYCFPIGASFAP